MPFVGSPVSGFAKLGTVEPSVQELYRVLQGYIVITVYIVYNIVQLGALGCHKATVPIVRTRDVASAIIN